VFASEKLKPPYRGDDGSKQVTVILTFSYLCELVFVVGRAKGLPEVFRNLIEVFKEEIHQGQVAQIDGGGATVAAAFAEPAVDSGHGAGADGGDVFLANLPFSVEGLGRHAELAVAVSVNQALFVSSKGTGIHLSGSVSKGSRSSSQAMSALIQAALGEFGSSQMR